jgi:hypothetical protein
MDPSLSSDGKSSPKRIGSAKSTTKWEPCDCGCSRRKIPLDVRRNRSYREDRQGAYPCGASRRKHTSRGRLLEPWDATAVVVLYFRRVELLSPAKNWSVEQGRAAHQRIEARNATRSPAATLASWGWSSMAAGGQLAGVEGKNKGRSKSLGSDRCLVILCPLQQSKYLMCKRDWCFSFNLRHTHTTLPPHWRNSSTIADESECGFGVIDTSPYWWWAPTAS